MKKIFSVLLMCLLFITAPNSIGAETFLINDTNENLSLTKEAYSEVLKSGVLDETITYDKWLQINSEDRSNPIKEHSILLTDSLNAVQSLSATLVRGDILISNGTSSFGLTGHAGIVVGADEILHIRGDGYSPDVIPFEDWEDRYGKARGGMVNTEIYRISNWTYRNNAATWANKNYKKSGASYNIVSSLTSLDPTYCSKIVWQAYRYGSSVSLVDTPSTGIATPYGLPTYFKSTANLSYIGNF